jgi:beta-phosphoglucomutase-like phosphatase (HAD superfamily)
MLWLRPQSRNSSRFDADDGINALDSSLHPDIFLVALKKLKIEGKDAAALGDSPYDAEAACKTIVSLLVYSVKASSRR